MTDTHIIYQCKWKMRGKLLLLHSFRNLIHRAQVPSLVSRSIALYILLYSRRSQGREQGSYLLKVTQSTGFLNHRLLQARLLPIYCMHYSTRELLFYMWKVMSNIKLFLFFFQCWKMKMWKVVNEIWAWRIFLKAMSIMWQLRRRPQKQMFPLHENNKTICYTDNIYIDVKI